MKWLSNPDDERIKTALSWTCDVCRAGKLHLCSNTVKPKEPLPGRLVHFGRLVDRRKSRG